MYLFIEGDINDADYVSKMEEVSQEQIDFVQPVIVAIKENKGDFRDIRDLAYVEEIYDQEYDGIYSNLDPLVFGEFLETYVPMDTQTGDWCHTITEISIIGQKEIIFERD